MVSPGKNLGCPRGECGRERETLSGESGRDLETKTPDTSTRTRQPEDRNHSTGTGYRYPRGTIGPKWTLDLLKPYTLLPIPITNVYSI